MVQRSKVNLQGPRAYCGGLSLSLLFSRLLSVLCVALAVVVVFAVFVVEVVVVVVPHTDNIIVMHHLVIKVLYCQVTFVVFAAILLSENGRNIYRSIWWHARQA